MKQRNWKIFKEQTHCPHEIIMGYLDLELDLEILKPQLGKISPMGDWISSMGNIVPKCGYFLFHCLVCKIYL